VKLAAAGKVAKRYRMLLSDVAAPQTIDPRATTGRT
jgi:hypothetical protein